MKSREEIIKILTDIEYYAGKDHYEESVIEEEEPFWWRIRPKWAEEMADRILADKPQKENEET